MALAALCGWSELRDITNVDRRGCVGQLSPNSLGGEMTKDFRAGKVLGRYGHMGRAPGTVDWVHAIACPDEKTVYVAEELGWRLDKLVGQ